MVLSGGAGGRSSSSLFNSSVSNPLPSPMQNNMTAIAYLNTINTPLLVLFVFYARCLLINNALYVEFLTPTIRNDE